MNLTLAILFLLQGAPVAKAPAFEDLRFFAGCWKGTQKGIEGTIEESYSHADGGLVLGTSRRMAGGRAVFWELIRIERGDDGVTRLTNHLKGGKEAWFKLVHTSAREAIFENPTYDFPNRVLYRVLPTGSLYARVESVGGKAPKVLDFEMAPVRCPGK